MQSALCRSLARTFPRASRLLILAAVVIHVFTVRADITEIGGARIQSERDVPDVIASPALPSVKWLSIRLNEISAESIVKITDAVNRACTNLDQISISGHIDPTIATNLLAFRPVNRFFVYSTTGDFPPLLLQNFRATNFTFCATKNLRAAELQHILHNQTVERLQIQYTDTIRAIDSIDLEQSHLHTCRIINAHGLMQWTRYPEL